MNIYEKIQAVGNEIMTIEKNLVVGTGSSSYKAVGDLDVTIAVKKAEEKFGLVSIPIKQELVNSQIIDVIRYNGKEAKDFIDTIKLTLEIVNIENPEEKVTVESYGKGIDSGDKGLGKASTYARKYALMNAYKIATGEDPDANKPEDTPQIKEDETANFVKDYLMQNLSYSQELMKFYNVESFDEFSKKQLMSIEANILKKQRK